MKQLIWQSRFEMGPRVKFLWFYREGSRSCWIMTLWRKKNNILPFTYSISTLLSKRKKTWKIRKKLKHLRYFLAFVSSSSCWSPLFHYQIKISTEGIVNNENNNTPPHTTNAYTDACACMNLPTLTSKESVKLYRAKVQDK